MRVVIAGLLLSGLLASAQELSLPPPPPSVPPEPMLPGAPRDETAQGFNGAFSSRISFFAANKARRYDVSLDGGRQRCKTPCTLELGVGSVELTTTRDGYSLTQDVFIPTGQSHVRIGAFSPPMVVTGAVLMGLSATALVAAAVLMVTLPFFALGWFLFLILPSAAFGIPGVVLTAVGANRHTTLLTPGVDPSPQP